MGQDQQGTFIGCGGIELYYQSWHPPVSPCAIVVIIHGLGGHSGLFGNIVNYLLPRNYTIYACDLRGHGRSPGQRGHINKWDELRSDLGAFLKFIKQRELPSPYFLLGHSLGAIVVLDYVLRFPEQVQGVIALAPPLGQVGISWLKLMMGRILSQVWPRFSLNTGIALEAGTRDEKVLQAYLNDPLRHTQGTARLATEFFSCVNWVNSHASDLKVPLLMLLGGADMISLPDGSRNFFARVIFPDKEKIEYPDAYHELHNELNYQEIVADLGDWLQRHQK